MGEKRDSVYMHRFAILTAIATFFLIMAGALVVGNEAGLAVPDWPLSYGTWMPPMEGGVFYEHGHRMVATTVGFLTTVLVLWIWRKEPRSWVKRLGWTALAAVIVQGVLGGITVLYFLPAPVSITHACLAQAFFCIVLSLAVFTSPAWQSVQESHEDSDSPAFRHLCLAASAAVYIQLALGAAVRHRVLGVLAHLLWAGMVTVIMLWMARRASVRWHQLTSVHRLSGAIVILLILQLILGAGSYFIREATKNAVQPQFSTVWITTAHVAIGALLLGFSWVLTLMAYRKLPCSSKIYSMAGTPEKSLV
ncbi:MAG: hypothetical protein A3F68_00770 [Acidobacteria bacterium RIFCSPLOWO2_12_FULL_54_10]|nr:MAG: hypothetical protein A3F68_00770 [Acidobacteria bacterium RIFCSPLOWO2_12_FULL_54_10]